MKFIVAPLLLTILQNISSTFGANILVFMPLPFPSHIRSYKPLFKELASTGHDVTFYTGSPFNEQIPNMKQIVIDNMARHMDEFLQTSLKEDKNAITGWRHINFLWKRAIFACEKLFENPKIQELIRSTDLSYDVILLETFFSHEPFVALSHKFNAPIINLHPIKAEEWISDVLKNPQPLSYVPNIRLPATDRMNFYERIQNVILSLIHTLTGHFYYIPEQEKLMKKFFKYPGSETLPSLLSLLKNTSLTFLDSNSIISSTSPHLPNFISVGGIHISDNKKLSDDLEKWINDSPHGVIYLSFGSHIKISDLEPEKLNVFLKVLGNLPQRILWKWEKDGNIPGQPPNVKTSKWFPQLDILVHPKCLAFITHGGFHSVFEAAYFGVPIVGVPIFFDQESNLIMAENKGFAQMIKLPNLSINTLSTALNNVLNNQSYKENAEYVSKLIKDVPFTPLQTAVYWVDYIIRHKGASHLKPYGAFLPWYQYYLIDIIATAIIITTFTILIIYISLKITLRFCSNIVTKKSKRE